jgi:hypothetical protein
MWGILDDRERKARKAVLTLISEGRAPREELVAAALNCYRAEAGRLLDELASKGYVVRNGAQGAITTAYPLSALPTRHRVTLQSGQSVYALCAVDALGVSPLFGVSATIEARCPHCERIIRLDVHDAEVMDKDPSTAVLWYSMADLLEKRIEGLNLAAEH